MACLRRRLEARLSTVGYLGERVFIAQARKFRAAGGVEAFIERHRLLQQLHRFAGFAEMHPGSGKKIENSSTVNISRKQLFNAGDLRANFRSVIGLGRGAANFVFLLSLLVFLLSSEQV